MFSVFRQKLGAILFLDIPDEVPPDTVAPNELRAWGEKFNRNYAKGNFRLKLRGKVLTRAELDERRKKLANARFA